MGGQTRNYIASIDASNGSVNGWAAGANGYVRALAVLDENVFAGGDFTNVGGYTRNYMAKIDSNGTVVSWNPNANAAVYSLMATDTKICAGGDFTSMDGFTKVRFAAIEAASGTISYSIK